MVTGPSRHVPLKRSSFIRFCHNLGPLPDPYIRATIQERSLERNRHLCTAICMFAVISPRITFPNQTACVGLELRGFKIGMALEFGDFVLAFVVLDLLLQASLILRSISNT